MRNLTLDKVCKVFCNYHLLLGLCVFVWIAFYNGEFWLKVNEYIQSYNAEILQDIKNQNLLDKNEQNNSHQAQNLSKSFIDSPFMLKSSIFLAMLSLLWLICEILILRAYAVVFVGVSSYFLDSLHISFNPSIIDSLLQTNWREASDYFSVGFVVHLCVFVGLPLMVLIGILFKAKPHKQRIKFLKGKILVFLCCVIAILYLAQGARIIEVFKAQKLLLVLNPFAPIRASIDLITDKIQTPSHYTHLGQDAKTTAKNKLVIFVIGESARAQNFAYNGYKRNTNPHTSKIQNLIYFRDFTSCGVITAISVPCMLTPYPRKDYSHRNLSFYSDSVLDVVKKAGVSVYWLSNNGGECVGGVCNRLDKDKVMYFNKSGQFDGDMLPHIESIIKNASNNKIINQIAKGRAKENSSQNNTLLVVQLQGSHGARYDLRYPKEFERFSPVCANNELSQCNSQHIQNAYDNSLIYSDFLLASIIKMLDSSTLNEVALWYVSDHGESLGEYGQYMHGSLPYSLAPKVQKHIPSFMWFKSPKAYNAQNLESKKANPYSHDFVFHTLLGLLQIQTKDYDKSLDMLK